MPWVLLDMEQGTTSPNYGKNQNQNQYTKVDGLIWLLVVVCYLTLLGVERLNFTCVCKCKWRSHDQSHKVLELISNCYGLSKSIDSEP